MGPNSDIDLLVIKHGRFNRGRVTEAIYRNLHGVDAAVDVVLVTRKEADRYRNTPCLVVSTALKEGRIIYAARAIPS